jgi:hypothetical protein
MQKQKKKKTFVFGLGTGRTRSTSVASALNSLDGFYCVHEGKHFPKGLPIKLPWDRNLDELKRVLEVLRHRPEPFVGDIGMYFLSYVEEIMDQLLPNEEVFFVCLWRDREEVIRSFLAKDPGINLWSSLVKNDDVHDFLPKYPHVEARKCLELYWDEYRERSQVLAQKYPNFFLVHVEDIDCYGLGETILKNIGYECDREVVMPHLNSGGFLVTVRGFLLRNLQKRISKRLYEKLFLIYRYFRPHKN